MAFISATFMLDELLQMGDTYDEISSYIRIFLLNHLGTSPRSIRRFVREVCGSRLSSRQLTISDEQLDDIIQSQVFRVRHTYGRRSITIVWYCS